MPIAGPLVSPNTQLTAPCDTSQDSSCEVENIFCFRDPDDSDHEDAVGIVVLCVDEFRSKDPEDYQVLSYTEIDEGTGELKGLVVRAGTNRVWPTGTWASAKLSGWAWDQVWRVLGLLSDREYDSIWGEL